MKKSLADTKVSAGGGGSTPGTRTQVNLWLVEKPMVEQVDALQAVVCHGGADGSPWAVWTAACGEAHTGAGGCGLKPMAYSPWTAPAEAGPRPKLQPMKMSLHSNMESGVNCCPWRSHVGAVCS